MPLSSATAASADKMTKKTITKRVPAAILVDGPNFGGVNVEHFQLLQKTIIQHLEAKLAQDHAEYIETNDNNNNIVDSLNANTKFRVFIPPGGLQVFFTNPQDDFGNKLISKDECFDRQRLHSFLEREDWKVNLADRKQGKNGEWKAADDVLMAQYANNLSSPGFFEPVGVIDQRVTAKHLFIVTNDKDHLSTFTSSNSSNKSTFRHIVLTNGCKELEKAGDRFDRILRLHKDVEYIQELEQLKNEHRQQKKVNKNNDNSKSSSSQNISFTSVSSSSGSKTSLDDDDDDDNTDTSPPKTPPPAAATKSTKTFAELAKTKAQQQQQQQQQQQETSSKNQQQKQQEQKHLVIIGPSPSDKKNKKGDEEKTAAKIAHDQYRPRYVPEKGLVDYKQYIIIEDKLVFRRDLSTTKGIEPFEEGNQELKTYARWCKESCSGNCSKGSDCWGAHPREGMSKKEVMANAKELPRDPSRVSVSAAASAYPARNDNNKLLSGAAAIVENRDPRNPKNPRNMVCHDDWRPNGCEKHKCVFYHPKSKGETRIGDLLCQNEATKKGKYCQCLYVHRSRGEKTLTEREQEEAEAGHQQQQQRNKQNDDDDNDDIDLSFIPDPETATVIRRTNDEKKEIIAKFTVPFSCLPAYCQRRYKRGKDVYVCTHFYDDGVCRNKKCTFVHISGGAKQEKEEETVFDANNLAFQHGLQLDSSINNNTATAVADASSTGKKKKKNKSSKKAEESFPVTENNNDDDDQQQQGTSSAAADLMDLLLKELEEN